MVVVQPIKIPVNKPPDDPRLKFFIFIFPTKKPVIILNEIKNSSFDKISFKKSNIKFIF